MNENTPVMELPTPHPGSLFDAFAVALGIEGIERHCAHRGQLLPALRASYGNPPEASPAELAAFFWHDHPMNPVN